MQIGQVIGHATATVKHPTLSGSRLVVVQPLDAQGKDDGAPILAIDQLGSARRDRVMISSDGKAVREMVGAENTPIRWAVIGLIDAPPMKT
jgi:ethanolamine utilization protein EutN